MQFDHNTRSVLIVGSMNSCLGCQGCLDEVYDIESSGPGLAVFDVPIDALFQALPELRFRRVKLNSLRALDTSSPRRG